MLLSFDIYNVCKFQGCLREVGLTGVLEQGGLRRTVGAIWADRCLRARWAEEEDSGHNMG